MEEIKAWGCSHCAMTSRYKGHANRHEAHHCKKNPDRQFCGGCKFLEFEDACDSTGCPINPETHGNYESYEPAYWWCAAADDVKFIEHEDLNKTNECKKFKSKIGGK